MIDELPNRDVVDVGNVAGELRADEVDDLGVERKPAFIREL